MPAAHLRHMCAARVPCGLQTDAGKLVGLGSYACLTDAAGYTGAPGPCFAALAACPPSVGLQVRLSSHACHTYACALSDCLAGLVFGGGCPAGHPPSLCSSGPSLALFGGAHCHVSGASVAVDGCSCLPMANPSLVTGRLVLFGLAGTRFAAAAPCVVPWRYLVLPASLLEHWCSCPQLMVQRSMPGLCVVPDAAPLPH